MINFWLCFVPLFVAVDAIGVLPMFLNLTEGLDRPKIKKIIKQSTLTATGVAIVFLAVGKIIFNLLGITVADFMIAGGLLLFVISLKDMMSLVKREVAVDPESVAAVPIGVPLIVGPAVLTTLILLGNEHGFAITATAAVLNIALAGFLFSCSASINRVLGKSGSKTVSKIMSLILAAIAVMMIRKGLIILITANFPPHI